MLYLRPSAMNTLKCIWSSTSWDTHHHVTELYIQWVLLRKDSLILHGHMKHLMRSLVEYMDQYNRPNGWGKVHQVISLCWLTQWDLGTAYGNTDLGQYESGNGFLPKGTKQLYESVLTSHLKGLLTFTWGQFHSKCSKYLPLIWVWKSLSSGCRHISQGSMSYLSTGSNTVDV